MLTLKERYQYWRESDEGRDIKTLQIDLEIEILTRLLSGKVQYKQTIINHTCIDMFTDKDTRAIYSIILKFLETHTLKELMPFNIMLWLDKKDVKYIHYFMFLKQNFICSADSDNWLIRLHALFEKRLLADCKNFEDIRSAQEIIDKYKMQNYDNDLSEVAINYLMDYDKKQEHTVKTNYPKIDELLGGFQGGNYVILAGATGMGKTAMALNMLLNIAKQGKKVIMISLEMTTEELLTRIISKELKIPSERIRNRALSTEEFNKYAAYTDSESFKQFRDCVTIPQTTNLDISKIEGIVRKNKADIIFIDYLGLIQADANKNRMSSYEIVSDISRRLKLLAIETQTPIICLHQLNRAEASRKEKKPLMSDLRDSGKIEQDADFITFVFRPYYYNNNLDPQYMEFIIAKARHTGAANQSVLLNFDGLYQNITEKQNQRMRINDTEF